MSTEIKTLNGWIAFADRTGRTRIYDYLRKGDIAEVSLADYFMNIMPPRAMSYGYLQMGEPYNHVYDIDCRFRATNVSHKRADLLLLSGKGSAIQIAFLFYNSSDRSVLPDFPLSASCNQLKNQNLILTTA